MLLSDTFKPPTSLSVRRELRAKKGQVFWFDAKKVLTRRVLTRSAKIKAGV